MYARERSRLDFRLLLDSPEYAELYAPVPLGGTVAGMPVFFCDCDDTLLGDLLFEEDRRPALCTTIHSTVAPGVEFFHKKYMF